MYFHIYIDSKVVVFTAAFKLSIKVDTLIVLLVSLGGIVGAV